VRKVVVADGGWRKNPPQLPGSLICDQNYTFIQRAPPSIDSFESRSPAFSCHPLIRAAIIRSASSTIPSAASPACSLAHGYSR